MRVVYTLALAAITAGISIAQPTIGSESQPQVGDQWAFHNLILPLSENPIPTIGSGIAYDFSFIGDIIDPDLSDLPINMVDLDDMLNLRVREVFTQADVSDGTTLPDFANTVVSTELYVPNDYTFGLIGFLDILPEGIFQLGDGFFIPGVGLSELDFPDEAGLNVPFGLGLGDSLYAASSDVSVDVDFGSEDSTFNSTTFAYLGTGSLVTHFGDYDEIAVIRSIDDIQFFTRDIGSSDPFTFASRQIQVYYEFVLPGSFSPLITYDYSTFDLDNLTPATDDINIAFGLPRVLSSTDVVEASAIQLEVFPNPATERITLSFEQRDFGQVELQLIDPMGRMLKVWTSAGLSTGPQQLTYELPASLPAGNYWLRLSTNQQLATLPLQIH
ncbi:MAG: T9SS type A sorting domain-containing protein [Bacteroidota bacterium]